MNPQSNNDKKKADNKIRRENSELKRQIKFLGEICRRCNSGGSADINGLYQSGMMTKQDICKTCDITYCPYNGKTKEEITRQKSTGADITPQIQQGFMSHGGMGFGGGFGPGGFGSYPF